MASVKSQLPRVTPQSADGSRDFFNVMPSLISAYRERGYEAGYARGVNDTLAAVLEATESFARRRPESVVETRQLLHAFSAFLEQHVQTAPPSERGFIDGSGI